MNPFDMTIVVILGYCIIRGIFRGLIRELASIIGVAVGFFTAYLNYKSLSPFLSHWIKNPAFQDIVSFIIIFSAVVMLITGAGILLRMIIKMILLGVVDRFLGALFGAIKGALIGSLLFILLVSFLPPGGAAMVADSKLSPYVNAISNQVVKVIPDDMKKSFMNNIEELKKSWENKPV